MFGAVAVDLDQEFVRDPAELAAQLARHRRGVELGAFAHDRLNGVDVMGDQFRRDQVEVGRMLDDAAKAFGGSLIISAPRQTQAFCGSNRKLPKFTEFSVDISLHCQR